MFKFSLCILFVAPSLINYSRPCGQVEGARVWWSPAPLDIWTFRASWIRIAWLQIVTCLNFWEKVAHKQFNLNIKNDHLIMLRKMFGLILLIFGSNSFLWWRVSLLEYVCMVVSRVAELGSISLGEKLAMKIFVKRVITIFATNGSFLCVIANLQI